MPKELVVTDEHKARIIAAYTSGITSKAVCKLCGIQKGALYKLLGEWGVPLRKQTRSGHPPKRQIVDGKRACSVCKLVKPVSAFSKSSHISDGYSGMCRACASDKNRVSRAGRYGMTRAEYLEKLDAQKGVCIICGKPETGKLKGTTKELAIDHDHATGAIRDLLCQKCNRALGLINENKLLCLALYDYLEKHGK